MAASGLVLALAGSLVSASPSGQGASGVALNVPHAVSAIALGGFAVAAVLLIALLVPRGVRRKKKGDEEFDLYYEPPKISPWAQALIIGLLLLPFVAVGYLVWSRLHGGLGPASVAMPGFGSLAGGGARVPVPPSAPVRTLPVFDVLVTVTACIAALAAAGIMLWLYFGDRLIWWWLRLPFDTARPLRAAIDESLDDLRDDPDPRRAIIGCYRRFERALAAAHVPRPAWQTPLEFMREALARAPMPSAAVERLTSLFEIARFSQRPLGASERDTAARALTDIKTALEVEAHNVGKA